MKQISDNIYSEIEVVQPSLFKDMQELIIDGIPTLKMYAPSMWKDRVVVSGYSKEIEFFSPSVWKSGIVARESGSEQFFAEYLPEKFGSNGIININNSHQIKLTFKFWKPEFFLTGENEDILVTYKTKAFFSTSLLVKIHKKSDVLNNYPHIIMLPVYISNKRRRHASVVV